MSAEFTSAINEAMGVLQTLAGSVWIWASQNRPFTAVQKTDTGNFSLMEGGIDYERTITLVCSRNDFIGGAPKNMSILYRQASPTVRYEVESDTSTENDIDPTFTLTLKLTGA